jgi:hypothetical protein
MTTRSAVLGLFTLWVGVVGVWVQAQPSFAQAKVEAETKQNDPPLPALPANCRPLPLVGGQGSEVTKTSSVPGLRVPLPGPAPSIGVRNNWNTDWFVPSGKSFRKYRVVFMPRDSGQYSVNMTLKYPDESNDQFYRESGRQFTANKPLIIETSPRIDLQPFQVNTNIGGVQAVGLRYTVAVSGCL